MNDLEFFLEEGKRIVNHKKGVVEVWDSDFGDRLYEKVSFFENRTAWELDERFGNNPFEQDGAFKETLEFEGSNYSLLREESGKDSFGSQFNWLTYGDMVVLEYGIYCGYGMIDVLKMA